MTLRTPSPLGSALRAVTGSDLSDDDQVVPEDWRIEDDLRRLMTDEKRHDVLTDPPTVDFPPERVARPPVRKGKA